MLSPAGWGMSLPALSSTADHENGFPVAFPIGFGGSVSRTVGGAGTGGGGASLVGSGAVDAQEVSQVLAASIAM